MTTEQKEKINQAVDMLAKDEDIITFVNKVESGIKTTKGNYGKYMQFLTNYADNNTMLYVVKEAIIKAGADIEGVNAAIGILKGSAL